MIFHDFYWDFRGFNGTEIDHECGECLLISRLPDKASRTFVDIKRCEPGILFKSLTS